jgi:hypothetical protein
MRIATVLALICLTTVPARAARVLTLVEQGKSDYAIVTPAHPTAAESLAADELARYLKLISGAQLQIRTADTAAPHSIAVRVEPPPKADSKRPSDAIRRADGYSIRTDAEGRITIAGGGERGLLHGAYALLTHLGCRFLAPQFDHYNGASEFIPHRETLTLPADLSLQSQPTLAYRKLYVEEGLSHDEATLRRMIAWMPKAGYNVLVIPTDYQNHGRVKWDNWRAALAPELQRRGLVIEVGGHGYPNFLSAGMPDPAAPGKTLFDTHPDWFATDSAGQRRREPNWVFNTANPDAVHFMVARLVDYVRQRPEIQIFDLWPPDGERWDESAAGTKQGTPTDRMVLLTNLVRAELAKVRPDVRVECIAYARYTTPPAAQRLDPSVLLDFCPINQSFEYSLADVASARNAAYAADLAGWRRAFDGDVSLYSYYRKYAWNSLPVLLPHYLASELRHFATVPLQGVSTYSEPADWYTYELNHYALTKLAWDPSLDVDVLVKDFCVARYGPAADLAGRTFAALEDTVRTCGSIPFASLKSADQLETARHRLDQVDRELRAAATAGAADTALRRNLEKLRLTCEYAVRDLRLQSMRVAQSPAADVRREVESLRTFLVAHRGEGIFLVSDQRPSLATLLKKYGARDR